MIALWADERAAKLAGSTPDEIATALMAAYNQGLEIAREGCQARLGECKDVWQRKLVTDLSTYFLHMQVIDGDTDEPVGLDLFTEAP